MDRISLKIFLGAALISCILMSCSEKEHRKVLIVHSYEESYAAYPDFNKMIAESFQEKDIQPDIRVIYLDCESRTETQEITFLNEQLSKSTNGWKPDIILVYDDQATYSLLKSGHPLIKEKPIVFGGVNYPNMSLIAQYPNITGFRDKIDFMTNIKAVNEIFADRKHCFTIIDYTYLDRQIRQDAKEQVKNEKVKGFMNSKELNAREWKEFKRDEDSIYFMGIPIRIQNDQSDAGLLWNLSQYTKDRCYIQLKRDFTTINIGNICASPCITAINEGFGYDEKLFGGYFTPTSIQVSETVNAAVRILHGEKPANIPLTNSAKSYMIDWKVAKKMELSNINIPEKYIIVNISFDEKYPLLWRWIIFSITIGVVALIISLIFLFYREQQRKKNALIALENKKEALELSIEGSDTHAWKLENDIFVFETSSQKSQHNESQHKDTKAVAFEKLIEYVHPDFRNEAETIRTNTLLNYKVVTHMRCNFNEKGYQWWEFRYKTIALANGKKRTAGLLLNIQEIKIREHELEEARLLAEKAELKQSFLANMSHEIRTPLNAIVGFSNILAADEELSPDERSEYIETINKNSDLLLKLINDILEISRIESGNMSFDFSLHEVKELVDEIYLTHQLLIPKKLKFIKEQGTTPIQINVDKGRLTQVITNFLNNASKFTESGYIKLGYNYLPGTSEVAIYVEDTGCGIPKTEQKMIFSRFYKQNEFSQGTGLGLSISQVIIEKLQGRIELWSEFGKGSRFTIILPIAIQELT